MVYHLNKKTVPSRIDFIFPLNVFKDKPEKGAGSSKGKGKAPVPAANDHRHRRTEQVQSTSAVTPLHLVS